MSRRDPAVSPAWATVPSHLDPAIAANPFIAFHTVATESGTIELKWTGDNGFSATEQVRITVE